MSKTPTPPKLKKGERYAGISLHEGKPCHLVLLPGDEEKNWKDAGAWAAEQGGELPNRHDALVLHDNLNDQFQRDWYWTSVPYAHNGAYAWFQSFYYGDQDGSRKDDDYRARAVRRVAI